jgi:hypothetical protein
MFAVGERHDMCESALTLLVFSHDIQLLTQPNKDTFTAGFWRESNTHTTRDVLSFWQYTHDVRNIVTRLHNQFCRAKTLTITYSECGSLALVTQHEKRMNHIVVCGLSGSIIFFHGWANCRFKPAWSGLEGFGSASCQRGQQVANYTPRASTWKLTACWLLQTQTAKVRHAADMLYGVHYTSVSQPLWDRGPVNNFLIRRGPGAQKIYS